MHRAPTWDAQHRNFFLAPDYRAGRPGSVPLDSVAPRCWSCGHLRPKEAAQFMGRGKGGSSYAGTWRAVVLPADEDRGQLRWLTEQGAFMVVPVCPRCQKLGTMYPLDFEEWDRQTRERNETFLAQQQEQEPPEIEIERTREGFR